MTHAESAVVRDLPPFNGTTPRENLGVEQTKGGIQCHAERKSRLSRSSPVLREVEVGRGKTVAKAVKKKGLWNRGNFAARPAGPRLKERA